MILWKNFRVAIEKIITNQSVKNQFAKYLLPGKSFDIEKAKLLFEQKTNIQLHIGHTDNLFSFSLTPGNIIKLINSGKFPSDFKHVLIGHGTGTVIDNSWRFSGNNKDIFEYIRQNIPLGEKVLVTCCEETPKELRRLIQKDKPGIGNIVHTELTSHHRPAKIVISGQNQIIGHYAKGKTEYY